MKSEACAFGGIIDMVLDPSLILMGITIQRVVIGE